MFQPSMNAVFHLRIILSDTESKSKYIRVNREKCVKDSIATSRMKGTGTLVIDEYAAGVVRDIFAMKLCGLNQQIIADRLNNDGILSPVKCKKSIGINLETTFKKRTQVKWSYIAVLRILKNEVYTGVLTQGKQTTPNYKVKIRVMKLEIVSLCFAHSSQSRTCSRGYKT